VRRAAAVVALLVAGVACGDDDEARPGELLEQDDVMIGAVEARRIRYGSVDVNGDPSEVGALLAVPDGPAPPSGWPVVAYAHPTTGGADACAPSADPALGEVGRAVTAWVGAGYVVVATDYEGIGAPGAHPYLHGGSAVRSIVDSVRAAREAVPAAGRRWAAVGWSQGGHAALFVAEQAAEQAPELELVGSVAIAPVVDLTEVAAADEVLGTTFLVLAINGFLATDPDVDVDDLLTDVGRDAIADAEERCQPRPVAGDIIEEESDALDAYFAASAVGQAPATVPILVQQGDADQLTTPDRTSDAVGRLCELGDTVALRSYAGADHTTVVQAGATDAAAWVADRFAGAAAPSTC